MHFLKILILFLSILKFCFSSQELHKNLLNYSPQNIEIDSINLQTTTPKISSTFEAFLTKHSKEFVKSHIMAYLDTFGLVKAFQMFEGKPNLQKLIPVEIECQNIYNFMENKFEDSLILYSFPNFRFKQEQYFFKNSWFRRTNLKSILFMKKENKFILLNDYVCEEKSICVLSSNSFNYANTDLKLENFTPLLTQSEELEVFLAPKMFRNRAPKKFLIFSKQKNQYSALSYGLCKKNDKSLYPIFMDDKMLTFNHINTFKIPENLGLVLKCKKYSKFRFFKFMYKFLNCFTSLINIIPGSACLLKTNFYGNRMHASDFLKRQFGFLVFAFVPLFVETSLPFLSLIYENPHCGFIISILPTITGFFHLNHFYLQNMKVYPLEDFWLLPFLDIFKNKKRCMVLQIIFIYYFLIAPYFWSILKFDHPIAGEMSVNNYKTEMVFFHESQGLVWLLYFFYYLLMLILYFAYANEDISVKLI